MDTNPRNFQESLTNKIDAFIHTAYDIAKKFPQEELFVSSSQLRRATLSIGLNYAEGYARCSFRELNRFAKIAYGSLKECLYLLKFAHQRTWIDAEILKEIQEKGDEIGKMLWSIFSRP